MTEVFTTYDHNLARQKFVEGFDVFIAMPDPDEDVKMTNERQFAEEEGHLFEVKPMPLKPLVLTGSEVALLRRLIRSQQMDFEINLDTSDVYSSDYLSFMLRTNELREKVEANQ